MPARRDVVGRLSEEARKAHSPVEINAATPVFGLWDLIRIEQVVTNGFVDAAPFIAKWMSRMPADITDGIKIDLPGFAHDESTDSDAFTCRNTPGGRWT